MTSGEMVFALASQLESELRTIGALYFGKAIALIIQPVKGGYEQRQRFIGRVILNVQHATIPFPDGLYAESS